MQIDVNYYGMNDARMTFNGVVIVPWFYFSELGRWIDLPSAVLTEE